MAHRIDEELHLIRYIGDEYSLMVDRPDAVATHNENISLCMSSNLLKTAWVMHSIALNGIGYMVLDEIMNI